MLAPSDLQASLLSGSRVTVETALSPPLSFALDGETGALSKFLRTKVAVVRNGQVLASYAPHGDPSTSSAGMMVLFLILAVLLLVVLK